MAELRTMILEPGSDKYWQSLSKQSTTLNTTTLIADNTKPHNQPAAALHMNDCSAGHTFLAEERIRFAC